VVFIGIILLGVYFYFKRPLPRFCSCGTSENIGIHAINVLPAPTEVIKLLTNLRRSLRGFLKGMATRDADYTHLPRRRQNLYMLSNQHKTVLSLLDSVRSLHRDHQPIPIPVLREYCLDLLSHLPHIEEVNLSFQSAPQFPPMPAALDPLV